MLMIFPFPGVLWVLIVILIVGIALLISTMRLRKSSYDVFILDTDTTQKTKLLLGNLIIDVFVIVSYISLVIYLRFNIYYVICITAMFVYLSLPFFKNKRYNFYIDYFREIRQKKLKQ